MSHAPDATLQYPSALERQGTQAELDMIEGDLIPVRVLRLEADTPAATCDLVELCAIHLAVLRLGEGVAKPEAR